MAKRKSAKKSDDEPLDDDLLDDVPIPASPASMEKLMSDLTRLLEEREFESIEEANAFLAEVVASGQPIDVGEPETPLEQAQELIYEAKETRSRRRRVKLAKQALELSPDCADAYLILAEDSARSVDKAVQYLEQGVAAGERAIGPEKLAELEGEFWGVLATRPYMRARLALAMVLWELGRQDETIEHYEAMLRLNPGDNQGVRYLLLNALLATGRHDDAEELLQRYDEPTAICTYTDSLLKFRRFGPSRKTTKRLQEAMEYNPFVPAYLLGEKRVPRKPPDYVAFGDDSEAADYASQFAQFWYQQEGALDWLRATREIGN